MYPAFRRKQRAPSEKKRVKAKKVSKSSSSNDSEEDDASDDVSSSFYLLLLWSQIYCAILYFLITDKLKCSGSSCVFKSGFMNSRVLVISYSHGKWC